MKKMKVFVLTLVFMMIFSAAGLAEDMSITINGEEKTFDPSPQIIAGTTLVPMRGFFEALGAEVQWENDIQTAIGKRDGIEVRIPIDNQMAKVDNKEMSLQVPAQLIDGSTFIPLRFVGESLGDNVAWNGESREIVIERTNGEEEIVKEEEESTKEISENKSRFGNIVNRSIAYESDGWIYYGSWQDSESLMKMRPDGSDKTEIIDMPGTRINVLDDWIYFTYCHDEVTGRTSPHISINNYRIKNDGSEMTIISGEEESSGVIRGWSLHYPNVTNDYIYYRGSYMDNYEIIRSDHDGSNIKIILDKDVSQLQVKDDWIYYNDFDYNIDRGKVYRVTTDGKSNEIVLNEKVWKFIIYDDYIYYASSGFWNEDSYLFRTDLEGNNKEVIINESGTFNIKNHWIYYSNNDGFFKVKADGTGKEKLSEHSAEYITILGDWIYYYHGDWHTTFRIKTDGSNRQQLRGIAKEPSEEIIEDKQPQKPSRDPIEIDEGLVFLQTPELAKDDAFTAYIIKDQLPEEVQDFKRMTVASGDKYVFGTDEDFIEFYQQMDEDAITRYSHIYNPAGHSTTMDFDSDQILYLALFDENNELSAYKKINRSDLNQNKSYFYDIIITFDTPFTARSHYTNYLDITKIVDGKIDPSYEYIGGKTGASMDEDDGIEEIILYYQMVENENVEYKIEHSSRNVNIRNVRMRRSRL